MDFSIIDIDRSKSSDEILDKYFDFYDKIYKEYFPKDPITPHDIRIRNFREYNVPGEILIMKVVQLEESKEFIARLFFGTVNEESKEYEKTKHIANVEVTVLKEFSDTDLADKLFKIAFELTKKYKLITVIEGCSVLEREWELWSKFGGKKTAEGEVNRLYLDEVDWRLMKKWKAEGQKRAKEDGISIQLFQDCPEEIIEEFTAFSTEIMNLVPFENLEWSPSEETPKTRREHEDRLKKVDYNWYTLVTREKNGALSGMTEIQQSKNRSYRINQELTGVKLEYRGRGLGKWLKAEMLFFIKEKLPEAILIHTGNAAVNAPMLSINRRMGFKKYLTERCYTIKLEELVKQISNNE